MAMNYLAGFVDNYGDNTWKRFVEGGLPTAILGILTVFAVLTILWGSLEIFKYVFYTLPKMREAAKKEENEAPASVPAPALATEQSYADDGAIVAAIIAAITAARAEEGIPTANGFRVVSFRKKK